MRFSFLPLLIALFCDLQFVDADVDYESQVKPLLKARCYSCHGGLKQEAGLRLDTGKLLRKGGADGSVIDSANPSNSSLIERVSADDESRMPPEGKPLDV